MVRGIEQLLIALAVAECRRLLFMDPANLDPNLEPGSRGTTQGSRLLITGIHARPDIFGKVRLEVLSTTFRCCHDFRFGCMVSGSRRSFRGRIRRADDRQSLGGNAHTLGDRPSRLVSSGGRGRL